jgi:hypothetical protein
MEPIWYAWFLTADFANGALLVNNNLSDVADVAESQTNLDVPSRTGTGATGTWAIHITGVSAASTKLVTPLLVNAVVPADLVGADSWVEIKTGTMSNPPTFTTKTSSSNVGMNFVTNGTGSFSFTNATTNPTNPIVFFPNGAAGSQGIFTWGTLSSNRTYTFPDNSGIIQIDTNDLLASVVGKGLKIKEGVNGRMGTATLVAGTVTVNNTSVTATTRIFISRSTTGGTVGTLSTTQIASTSFTINSSSATDTSTVNWLLIEPA